MYNLLIYFIYSVNKKNTTASSYSDDNIDNNQGPDLYAFIGFIGPDDINYMY